MKYLISISLLMLYLNIGCNKVEPPIEPQFPPQVSAGNDFYVIFPSDTTTLMGSFTKTQFEILQHSWRKIAGPSAYELEQPQSLQTKISKLQKGRYGFELTVTDKGGLAAKDSVYFSVVSVYKENASQNEVNFKDRFWECPWQGGCYISIEVDLQSPIPAGTPFKVYIKRDNYDLWIEAENSNRETDQYFWKYEAYELQIWMNDEKGLDKPDVKIVF